MEGFLSLLLFVGFCYLMMRFGCGSHMVHRHSASRGHRDAAEGSATREMSSVDPVCGTTVPASSGITEAYDGRSYRFCSRACLDKFDASPQHYVPKAAA